MLQHNIYDSGFTLRALPITESDEAELVAAILREYRSADPKRVEREGLRARSRVMRFGWGYGAEDKWLGYWPPFDDVTWFHELREMLPGVNSISVNEYRSGDGISNHTDSSKFDDTIYVLNLSAACVLTLVAPDGWAEQVEIPRRTMTVMAGDIRKTWKHGITPRRFPRARYSVVFRTRLGVEIPEIA